MTIEAGFNSKKVDVGHEALQPLNMKTQKQAESTGYTGTRAS